MNINLYFGTFNEILGQLRITKQMILVIVYTVLSIFFERLFYCYVVSSNNHKVKHNVIARAIY